MNEIIILASSLHHLRDIKVKFVFTDRHAYLKAAQFSADLEDLDWIIWDALQARDFRKDDADKFEKYQAEALVYKQLTLSGLLAVACFDDGVKSALETQATESGANVKIITRPAWYV